MIINKQITIILSMAIFAISFILFYKLACSITKEEEEAIRLVSHVRPFAFDITWPIWVAFIVTQPFIQLLIWGKHWLFRLVCAIIIILLFVGLINMILDKLERLVATSSSLLQHTIGLLMPFMLVLLGGLGIYIIEVLDRLKRRYDYYKSLPSEYETLKAERDELALKLYKCYNEIDDLRDDNKQLRRNL